MGLRIKDDAKDANIADGWWAKYREKRRVDSSYNKYKAAVLKLDYDYQIFKLELNYLDTNPIMYYLKFALGILFIIVSILWWL